MKTMLFSCAALIAMATVAKAAEMMVAEDGAADAGGFYMSAKIGMNVLDDLQSHYNENYTNRTMHEEHGFQSGSFFSGAAGWKRNFFRAEGEIEYTANDWDQVRAAIDVGDRKGTLGTFSPSGTWSALSIFANIYLDLDNRTAFTPFFFGGIGATQLSWDRFDYRVGNESHSVSDASNLVFSWKLGAGLAWNVWRGLFLDLTCRYLKTNSVQIHNSSGGYDYAGFAFSLGGRYQF